MLKALVLALLLATVSTLDATAAPVGPPCGTCGVGYSTTPKYYQVPYNTSGIAGYWNTVARPQVSLTNTSKQLGTLAKAWAGMKAIIGQMRSDLMGQVDKPGDNVRRLSPAEQQSLRAHQDWNSYDGGTGGFTKGFSETHRPDGSRY